MFTVPAHKQTDPAKMPAQTVNPVPLGENGRQSGTVRTLADYVEQIETPPSTVRSLFHAVALALVQRAIPMTERPV